MADGHAAPTTAAAPAPAGGGGGGGGSSGSSATREEFLRLYEELRVELSTKIIPKYEMPEEAVAWNTRVMDYNVPGGKLNRGLTVVHSLEAIKGARLSEADLKRGMVLGWCVEWLQAYFLVADDIMDASITRRGAPCWYRLPEVGMIAINDSFLLKSHIFLLLKRYFGDQPYYPMLLELFIDTTWQTELGQLLDLTSQPATAPAAAEGGALATPEAVPDLTRFTMERYRLIVKYKTAYYSFYLPVALAIVMCGIADDKTLKQAERILCPMGEYFQIQDDYLDCYGEPATIGKIGTDIQDNKCSWLVVKALAKCNDAQRAVLEANYGRHDDECVARIKALYVELDLAGEFAAYEAESFAAISDAIGKAAGGRVPVAVYEALLKKIYKRSK